MLHGEGLKWTAPSQPAGVSGCGAVGLCTHLLLACHTGEKTSSKRHVNRMMFFWPPVSSGWRYAYDTVDAHIFPYIQGDSPPPHSWEIWWRWEIVCWTHKALMPHSEGKKMVSTITTTRYDLALKISITFDLQGMKMILSECEDCGV